LRVLITGGAGFIGVHAAHHFAKKYDVLILDNCSRQGSESNLRWLQSERPTQVARVDIRNANAVAEVFKNFHPDVVLHLAAQVAVTSSVVDPRHDFEVNALGTLNVLEAVRVYCPRAVFLFASTNKVYGGLEHLDVSMNQGRYAFTDHPFGVSESEPLDFHSPYGCSKGAADQYVRDYARIYHLNTIVFRQSCIYGTRQFGVEDQGWLAWFAIASVTGMPITLYGDGKQVRDVLWVGDLVAAYEMAIQKSSQIRGQVFNIGGGSGNQISLVESLEILSSALGKPMPISMADWRPGDQKIFVADIRKAASDFGWKPKTSVAEGIHAMVRWVKDNENLFSKTFKVVPKAA